MTLNASKLTLFNHSFLVKLNEKRYSFEPNLLSKSFFTQRSSTTKPLETAQRAHKKSDKAGYQTARKPSTAKSNYLIEEETDYSRSKLRSERRNTTRY